jgi:hypothetical protein
MSSQHERRKFGAIRAYGHADAAIDDVLAANGYWDQTARGELLRRAETQLRTVLKTLDLALKEGVEPSELDNSR